MIVFLWQAGTAEGVTDDYVKAQLHAFCFMRRTGASRAAQQVYQGASAPVAPRGLQEITQFFDGLELVEPGVTDIALWPVEEAGEKIPLSFYGGVGIKA